MSRRLAIVAIVLSATQARAQSGGAEAEILFKTDDAGSNLIVMPGVSHMLCAEDPPAFHKHVLAFLDKVPAK